MVEPGRFARCWWVALPSAVRPFSTSLAAYLLDGFWAFAFRPLASLASPIVFILGLLVGTTRLGYEVAPFESIALIAFIVAVGTLGAHFGLAMLAGLVIGDFFLSGRAWSLDPNPLTLLERPGLLDSGLAGALARERLPLLIGYSLLAVVAIGMPILVKTMLAQLPLRDKDDPKLEAEGVGATVRKTVTLPTPALVMLSVAGHAFLTYFLVRFWVEATPVLIRPMWIWSPDLLQSRTVSLSLVQPLQKDGSLVVAAGVIASILRIGLQAQVRLDQRLSARISDLQLRLGRHFRSTKPSGKIRRLGRAVFRGLGGTLLLAGIVPTWADGLVLAVVLLAGSLFQSGFIPLPLGRWPVIAQNIPLLFRVVGAMVFLRLVVQPIAERLVNPQADTFRTFLVVVILGIVVFLLVLAPPSDKALQAAQP